MQKNLYFQNYAEPRNKYVLSSLIEVLQALLTLVLNFFELKKLAAKFIPNSIVLRSNIFSLALRLLQPVFFTNSGSYFPSLRKKMHQGILFSPVASLSSDSGKQLSCGQN
jgi:hypothetical protein